LPRSGSRCRSPRSSGRSVCRRRRGRGPRAGSGRSRIVPDDSWIVVDGGPFVVVGYTLGGAPYGIFTDETSSDETSSDEGWI
jgi:hypothetical protein